MVKGLGGTVGVLTHEWRPRLHVVEEEPSRAGHAARPESVGRLPRRVSAALLLALLLPVMAGAALAVKLQDGGAVFGRRGRSAGDGRGPGVRVFRTLTPDGTRITPVGRVLRATGVDELPQLLDALSGGHGGDPPA